MLWVFLVALTFDVALIIAWAAPLISALNTEDGEFARFDLFTFSLALVLFMFRIMLSVLIMCTTTRKQIQRMVNAPSTLRQVAFVSINWTWAAYFVTAYIIIPVVFTIMAFLILSVFPFHSLLDNTPSYNRAGYLFGLSLLTIIIPPLTTRCVYIVHITTDNTSV